MEKEGLMTAEQCLTLWRDAENEQRILYKHSPYRKHREQRTEIEWGFQALSNKMCQAPRGVVAALPKATTIADSTLNTRK
jgi:hypothetical protein